MDGVRAAFAPYSTHEVDEAKMAEYSYGWTELQLVKFVHRSAALYLDPSLGSAVCCE